MGGIKKEYRFLDGKPILAMAVLPFLDFSIDPIILTVPPKEETKVRKLLADFLDVSRLLFVEGGLKRQDSVRIALEALDSRNPDYVLIHDGARPWVDSGIIHRVLEGVENYGACIPVVSAQDAMKEVGKNAVVERHIPRGGIYCAQTPQGFSFCALLNAHRAAKDRNANFSDDGEVFAEFAGPVHTVPGDPANRKITYPHDMSTPGEIR